MKSTINLRKRLCWRFMSLFFATWTVVSCTEHRVYDAYQRVPVEGWEKSDSRLFSVSPVEEGGRYDIAVGLRTSAEYPFMSLALVVETAVIGADTCSSAVPKTTTDTLFCSLTDERGRSKGTGVSIRQFDFPVRTLNLAVGDSLNVRVRHCMRHDLLPGVRDLGLSVARNRH